MKEEGKTPLFFIPKPVFNFDFSTLMLFRCVKRHRAEQLQQGVIYFGSPHSWIQEEKIGNKGQGDILEGTFLSTFSSDSSDFIELLKNDPAFEWFIHKGFLFFRRKSVLDLRCLCLYGLRDTSFCKEISLNGRAHYKTQITQQFFSSFSDYKSREEYKLADPEEQPVVVFIKNPQEFFARIISSLSALGVKKEEIIISPVEYLDRYVRMVAGVPTPIELLLKDKSFEEQSEVRVIVNSKSLKYLEYMKTHNNTISVGSLEDLTEIYDYYFDDMSIERCGNKRLMFSLPEAFTWELQDLDFFELENILISILGETVELANLPKEWDTWDKKIKPLADVFRSKYGVLLHVDDNKKIYMYNLSPELLSQSHERHKNEELAWQFENNINRLIFEGKSSEAYNECISACKDIFLFGPANYYLGMLYSEQCRYQEAIEAFQKSFSGDYKRIESLDGIASSYFRQGKYDEAIETYNAIQDEKGYEGRIWCNIGICYSQLKQYKKAIDYYEKCITADKNDAFPWYNKGVAYYMQKEFALAKKCMEKAIELDPNNEIYKREYNNCFPCK